MKLKKIPFYFLRHGQTDWNKERIIMGHQDIPLNEVGRKQAVQSAQILKRLKITSIFHSSLSRAHETALIINEVLKVPFYSVEALKEKNCGELEGFSYKEGAEKRKQILDEWEGIYTPRNAETWEEFNRRTINAINDCLDETLAPTLIIAHGGSYRSISDLLKGTVEDISNCVPVYIQPQQNEKFWKFSFIDKF